MSDTPSVSEVPLVEIVIPVKNEQRELSGNVTRLVEHLRAGFPCAPTCAVSGGCGWGC
jgi:hypothetical protein